MTFRSYLSGLVIAGLVGMTAVACGDKGDDNDGAGLGGGRTGGTGGAFPSSGGSTTGGARTGGEGGDDIGEAGTPAVGGGTTGGTQPTTGGAGGEPPTETGGAGGEPPTETGGAGGEPPRETGGAGGEAQTGGAGGEPATETGGAGGEPATETGGAGGEAQTGGAGGEAQTGGAGGQGTAGATGEGGAGGQGTAGATGEGGAGGATGETTVTITDLEDTTVLEGGTDPLDGEATLGADLDDNAGDPGEPESLILLQPAAGALDALDGQTIVSATLVLTYYTANASGTDTADELEVFAVMEAWDAGDVTYDSLPEIYTEALATIPARAAGNPWEDGEEYSIDVTELVQNWLEAGVSFGIMVRNTGTDGADFYSADADDNQPRLEIVLAP